MVVGEAVALEDADAHGAQGIEELGGAADACESDDRMVDENGGLRGRFEASGKDRDAFDPRRRRTTGITTGINDVDHRSRAGQGIGRALTQRARRQDPTVAETKSAIDH